MEIRYAILNPTRNMTAIVLDSVPRADQPRLAARMLADESIAVEQAGFLEPAKLPGARARLQMMGGEFCGNATMSLAALLAMQDELPVGESRDYVLEVSGAQDLVCCRILRLKNGYRGTVSMPVPEEITSLDGYPLVRFPGIAHAIVPENSPEAENALDFARKSCAQCGADAFGVLIANPEMDRMRPLVYVRGTDSAVWECGCGSGTAAIGAAAAASARQNVQMQVHQPGGTIDVRADWQAGAVRRIEISGLVKMEGEGVFSPE